ncbi:MAG: DUF1588 domain-containing protein, partial [Polyangiaceae bacterium]|nr:DUF1588 domain-containing protein [Polyangiaceae bacterium]
KGLIAAFLQSPYFVYRLELEPTEIENFAIVDDTTHSSQQIVRFPVGGYERASRLSFFFWNRGPDEELLRAAREGDLNERSGVLAQAERLAQDERTLASWDEFFAGIFDEERWLTIAPSAEILSEIPEQLVGTAISESRAFLREEIFLREGGVKELFTSTRSWVDPTLAAIYGVEYPDVEDGPLYREVELPAEQRSGILTQLGFLASHATSRYPDPIHRGVYVAKRLACLTIAAPPDDIPPIPPAGERTNRERIAAHTESGTCANCHQYLINPFGFAFENYDAVGAYRDEDNDQPVDASVVIALDREEHAIDGAIELSQLFSTSPQVHECIAQHLISFAEGRTLARTPPPFVAELGNLSLQGASFQDLMIQLAASEAFLYRQEVVEKESPDEPLNDEQLDDEQEEESP